MNELMKMQKFTEALTEIREMGLCYYYDGHFLTDKEVENLDEDGQNEVAKYYGALIHSLYVIYGLETID